MWDQEEALSWNDLWKPAAGVAALMLATLPVAALADPLVVRSSGPSARSYPPGKALANDARIVLQSNDVVVILDGRGTRTLKGPGTFSPTIAAAPSSDNRATFASLVNQRTERRARIGAVRGVNTVSSDPAAGRSPNIWFVDTERSSTVCVADPSRLTMWRPDMSKAGTVTISGGGKTESVSWLKGQSAKPWPVALPIDASTQYKLAWKGSGNATTLKFALLGPNPEGLQDMAAALIQNGCDAQLDLLIETVAIPGGNTPAG